MVIAIALCVVLLFVEREELGLTLVFAILGSLFLTGIALALFQVSPVFFLVIVAVVDICLVLRLYGDIAVR